MPRHKLKLGAVTLLMLLAFGGTAVVQVNGSERPIQSQEDRDWSVIAELLKQGDVQIAQEGNDQTLFERRIKFFRAVAKLYKEFIDKYMDIGTERYVVAIFRLGVVWEKAGDDSEAIAAYEICDQHSKKNSAFYPRGEPLAPKIKARLKEARDRKEIEEKTEQKVIHIIIR